MKNLLIIGITSLFSIPIFGQINAQDSTVQVVAYWSKLETQSYDISYEKLKIKDNDTISRTMIKYEVDITVIDSTANSYTSEWLYKNFSIDTDNSLAKKLASITNEMSVKIKTDEMGVFIEVINWKDIRDYIKKAAHELEKKLKDVPDYQKITANIVNMYATKEAIEGSTIKDVVQFYAFHGLKYELGEQVEGILQTGNNFGGKPFDTDVKFSLDKIDVENGFSVFWMIQTIDSEQLTNETYNYLKKLGLMDDNIPDRKDFPNLTNQTITTSAIDGDTGWLLYSIESKEVKSEGTTNSEERVIELK